MIHTPSPANGINMFSTVQAIYKKLNFFFLNLFFKLFTGKAVFHPAYRQKTVFKPGFNRSKQKKQPPKHEMGTSKLRWRDYLGLING